MMNQRKNLHNILLMLYKFNIDGNSHACYGPKRNKKCNEMTALASKRSASKKARIIIAQAASDLQLKDENQEKEVNTKKSK